MSNAIVLNQLDLKYELEDNFAINTQQTKNYIERLKIIDKLPFNKGVVLFSESVWDFSQYTTLNIPKDSLIFKFNLCPEDFQDDIKSYVLVKILENKNKIQTINRKCDEISSFFSFMVAENIFSVHEITPSKISLYIKRKEYLAPKSMRILKSSILDFYRFYSANFIDLLTTDINKSLEQDDYGAYKATCEENKYSDIPKSYFNMLIKHILSVIDDNDQEVKFRATACILLILSQTGLRVSEVLELDINAKKEVVLINGEKRYYLEYKTWKRESGNNTYSVEKTYINDLSKKGFESLLSLHEENRRNAETTYLYVPARQRGLPVSSQSFNKSMLAFYSFFGNELDSIDSQNKYPELQSTQIHDKPFMNLHPNAKMLTYPLTPQFRVHVCTELYHKNVPLKYIAKFMGHLTSMMEGYYVRPKENQVQEDIAFSKKVIKDVITGNVNLLGPNASEFSEKLKAFLREDKYKVAKDIDEVVEDLLKTIPVRNKTGGVCIKSSPLRECSKDSMTNELFCAYGVCPNIFHFFYMIEVSYRQGKELVETITSNAKRGHKKQVQKELNMLKTIINQKIIPELDELKKEINKRGAQSILTDYPDLAEIIENFEEIYKEVEMWTNLKQVLSIS
ncbi:tyrosine-type recombinase/integrase [Candidatus Clostridium stratigraminis]|uniref:Tyrosine-type recombinase/integrase n=1 Tax=Candidatus Clostridium stratigraminis TaxID=3381661 RepID=A0ABW8T366_9CLOT